MGDIGELEQFLINLKHHIFCFFGRHDFDIHEVATKAVWGANGSSFYVSACPWCGKIIYGAYDKIEQDSK